LEQSRGTEPVPSTRELDQQTTPDLALEAIRRAVNVDSVVVIDAL
jgi:hypothetical protein